jgi:membrane protease YdiL (CAAX protease family)
MSAQSVSGWRRVLPFAVLIAAAALCMLILWAGPRITGLVISAFQNSTQRVDDAIGTVVIFGLILAGGLAGAAACGFNAARLGPRPGLRLAEGGAIGLVGFLVATALAAIAGILHRLDGGTSAGLFVGATALVLLQSGSEEIFFRGWLQPVLVRSWGGWGIAVTAIAFAALHLAGGARGGVTLLNLFLGGLLFGLLAARAGGLASAIGAHFAWNWAEALLLGLDPNPGSGSFGSILNLELVGSAWWGGSEEGLNASIAMTFALAILLVPLLILPARIPGWLAQYRSGRAPA